MTFEIIIYLVSALLALSCLFLIHVVTRLALARDHQKMRADMLHRRLLDVQALRAQETRTILADGMSVAYSVDPDGCLTIHSIEPVARPNQGSFADPEAANIIREHLGEPPYSIGEKAAH